MSATFRRSALPALAAAIVAAGVPVFGAGPPPKVDSADPSSAEQGSIALPVAIHGSNFQPGSQVRFLVSGTEDDDEIVVNNVTFVDPTRLDVDIDVLETAFVGDYDIEVLSNGRRGKGRERFAVTEKSGGNPSTLYITTTMRNDPVTDSVISEFPLTPTHDGSVTGAGNLSVLTEGGPGGGLVFQTENLVAVENPCASDPTKVCFSNGDPVVAGYDLDHFVINVLTESPPFNGQLCDGTPSTLLLRDMVTGECLKVYAASGEGSGNTGGGKNKHRGLKIRCGRHANEGDPLQATCTAHDNIGCLAWDVRPCLDNGGNLECGVGASGTERLICQAYETNRKGSAGRVELGEYQALFQMSIVRDN